MTAVFDPYQGTRSNENWGTWLEFKVSHASHSDVHDKRTCDSTVNVGGDGLF